jgi:hypothetical protein
MRQTKRQTKAHKKTANNVLGGQSPFLQLPYSIDNPSHMIPGGSNSIN